MKKFLGKIDSNTANIVINVFATFIIKGGSLIITFLTTPSYINYFDNSIVLGVWFTLLSVLSWILNFDLGIGNGLRNQIIKPLVEKNYVKVKKYISSAYVSIGLIVLSVMVIFIAVVREISWNSFLNISTDVVSQKVLTQTVFIVFSGIMVQFFLKLITSILYALQKPAIINLINLLNSLGILLFVNIASFHNVEQSLMALALFYCISVNLPLFIASIIIFKTSLRESTPNPKYFSKNLSKKILKLGGFFLWVQVLFMFLNGTNEFLISWLVAPNEVVEYQIYNRLFSLIGTIFTIALTPIWSAVTKAMTENNFIWIKKIYSILSLLSILIIIGSIIVIPFLQSIFHLWLGANTIQVNYSYALIFSIISSINIWNTVLSTIANGMGELKPQAILFSIAVIIKIPLSYVLVQMYSSWIVIVVANIVAMIPYCIFQPILLKTIINEKILSQKNLY